MIPAPEPAPRLTPVTEAELAEYELGRQELAKAGIDVMADPDGAAVFRLVDEVRQSRTELAALRAERDALQREKAAIVKACDDAVEQRDEAMGRMVQDRDSFRKRAEQAEARIAKALEHLPDGDGFSDKTGRCPECDERREHGHFYNCNRSAGVEAAAALRGEDGTPPKAEKNREGYISADLDQDGGGTTR